MRPNNLPQHIRMSREWTIKHCRKTVDKRIGWVQTLNRTSLVKYAKYFNVISEERQGMTTTHLRKLLINLIVDLYSLENIPHIQRIFERGQKSIIDQLMQISGVSDAITHNNAGVEQQQEDQNEDNEGGKDESCNEDNEDAKDESCIENNEEAKDESCNEDNEDAQDESGNEDNEDTLDESGSEDSEDDQDENNCDKENISFSMVHVLVRLPENGPIGLLTGPPAPPMADEEQKWQLMIKSILNSSIRYSDRVTPINHAQLMAKVLARMGVKVDRFKETLVPLLNDCINIVWYKGNERTGDWRDSTNRLLALFDDTVQHEQVEGIVMKRTQRTSEKCYDYFTDMLLMMHGLNYPEKKIIGILCQNALSSFRVYLKNKRIQTFRDLVRYAVDFDCTVHNVNLQCFKTGTAIIE